MQSYLQEVLDKIVGEHQDLQNLVIVLPSNRAVRTSQKIISSSLDKPCFAPKIVNIESFVKELSTIELAEELTIIMELYKLHVKHNSAKDEDFASFQSWGNFLLGDFNEIDRYLIPPQKIFDYLTAISKLNEWIKNEEPTNIITSYIKFSKNLLPIYKELNSLLSEKGLGYQGMVYRKAVENLANYLKANTNKKHFFIGLNALNGAEKIIIKTLLEEANSFVFWDIDSYFLNDKIHDAGFFIRQHLERWQLFRHKMFLFEKNCFIKPKSIEITSIAKNHSQVKFVGQLLPKLNLKEQKTALVLADESLLPLLLKSITIPLGEVNITMGYPLKKTNIAAFILSLLKIKNLSTDKGWFHKDIVNLLTNPVSKLFFNKEETIQFIDQIKTNNLSFISTSTLKSSFSSVNVALISFFTDDIEAHQLVKTLKKLLSDTIKENLFDNHQLEIEASALIYNLLNQTLRHLTDNNFLREPNSLVRFLESLIGKETITFKGDPDKGLQIMGVLETRGLDFENVIITSLNEGVLPAGKTTGSFIPYDVKREFSLPTTKEKDAIYAYHFYRLLQRAKNIHLIYNSDSDVLGGSEKSRFIHQLQTDPKIASYISNNSASPLTPSTQPILKRITKTKSLHETLLIYAKKGFSPSSLSTYIKNPYLFYKRHILNIDDAAIVDENIAHNVFGTIVHDTLESIYLPFIDQLLNPLELKQIKPSISDKVMIQFEKHYPKKAIVQGKNLIVYNVIQHYVTSVVDFDIETATKHQLKIVGLEEKLSMPLYNSSNQPIAVLKGKLDRIDEIDGKLRILDYKTGKVELSGLRIDDTQQLFSNKKYDKFFQLMCYALMVNSQLGKIIDEAAIIPIKSMKDAPLRVYFKNDKSYQISNEMLTYFQKGLTALIQEVLNPNIPFAEPK